MLIGFVRDNTKETALTKVCDVVIEHDEHRSIVDDLVSFVEKYHEHQLILPSNYELKIQLVQLLPVLEKAHDYQIIINFSDKQLFPLMSAEEHFTYLLRLARQEKSVMSHRSKDAITELKEQGKPIGRPTITEDLMQRIKVLYHERGHSIRDVSAICEVSVGTVHKYATGTSSAS
ncbi:hypothetical protein I6N95_16480 [Vagococcus sp. BWB3-3]|uniref:Resolvase HTH domain-containing protein n=1 Tax=Vagococcus allomyrinae TaxID=2794353 RepID=A0A940SW53_9ENTE|nr:hypothetical protein [Vagococcus allomyrinae]MBP1042614.1 hypothetical protein [Vagococcus allomyrinae]